MADFVTLSRNDVTIIIALYHCKGSGAHAPGARLDDVYEVCGQAQKSVAIANLARFAKRVRQRRGKTRYVRGSEQDLDALLQDARNCRVLFEVIVVQPGISKGALSDGMLELSARPIRTWLGSGAAPLRIIASP